MRPVVAGGTGASTVGAAQTAFKIPPYDGTPTITGAWIFNAANGITAQSLFSNTLLMGTSVAADTPSKITMRKARGGGTAAQITAGDDLGILKFMGYDGSAYQDACRIVGTTTTNTGNMGGVLEFYTAGTTLALTLNQNQDAVFVGDITAVDVTASGNVSAATFSGAGVSNDISADTGSTTKVPHVAAIEAAIAAAAENLTLETMQSASGTEVDFTGIPAGTKEVVVMFSGVSLSGTDNILVQLGDSGGFETTGYASGSGDAGTNVTSTSGFIIYSGGGANLVSGRLSLNLMDAATFAWVSDHGVQKGSGPSSGGGAKALSAELTQLRVTKSSGDTFDAGTINIAYR